MATPIQLAAAFTTIASRANHGYLRATMTADGIRIEVTDPAIQHDLVTAYDLHRDHSFSGVYAGKIRGVPVSVAMTTGIIPLQSGRVA